MRQRNMQLDRMWGRLYSVSGGQPNQPLVCLVSNAFWAEHDEDSWSPWLEPQVLSAVSCWFAAKDHAALRQWIEQDRQAWRDEVPTRGHLPVSILLDVSQAPASADILEPLRDAYTNIDHVMLTAGTDNALTERRMAQAGTTVVGAKWLISWFDSRIAKDKPQAQRHGRPYVPDRIVFSFDGFVDAEPPLMHSDEIRSSMSAAETLLKRALKADEDALLSLSADEVVATTVMLNLLAGDFCVPPTDYRPGGQLYGGMSNDDRRAASSRWSVA